MKSLTATLVALVTFVAPPAVCANLSWSPIHWESAKIGDRTVDRAALLIPVQLDGMPRPILVQLDLGADLSQFDSVAYEQLFGKGTAPRDKPKKLPFTGVFGGARVNTHLFDVVPQQGEPTPAGKPILLGTLGTDFFAKRMLILDFVRQRVAIAEEGAALPDDLEKRAKFASITVRDGSLFVPLSINGKTETDYFYDTGSSAFPMVTTKARWQSLTGRTGKEPGNEFWRVNSWGREAVMVGAPISGDIRLGGARLDRPLVFFESSGLPNVADSNLFGNALFLDRFTVIVDISGKRFGLIPGAAQ
jgi:hypothetical protein